MTLTISVIRLSAADLDIFGLVLEYFCALVTDTPARP